jgi:hypothetical protein
MPSYQSLSNVPRLIIGKGHREVVTVNEVSCIADTAIQSIHVKTWVLIAYGLLRQHVLAIIFDNSKSVLYKGATRCCRVG